MKNTSSTILSVAMVATVAFMASGCFSPMAWKESTRIVALKKAIARGDAADIAAVRSGRFEETEIEVSKMEVFKERPFILSGAALLDAGMVVGGALLADEALDSGSDGDDDGGGSTTVENNSGDTTVVNIDGDGNSVDISTPLASEGFVPQDGPE